MFKTIVMALDGSKGSDRIVPLGVALAKKSGAQLVIAHVDERTIGKGGGPINALEGDVEEELKKRAHQISEDEGVETSFEVRSVMVGGPAPAIAEVADEADADLILCGTRGHSPVSGLLLGSVAQRLLHIAHQPVLVVPESAAVEGSAATEAGHAETVSA
jgi:nucleotide-binding universal stress UspA family protein